MANLYTYRKHLYSNYYTNQAGRNAKQELHQKFDQEVQQFKLDIIPHLLRETTLKILDIGCGTGSLIAALKDAGYKNIKGIDISEEQVSIAHQLGVSEVQQSDIQNYFSSNEESYDLICGMDIIEHFNKDELVKLIILLKSRLRPNGKLIFRTPNLDAPIGTYFAYGDFTHECFLNKSSAIQLMLALGFKDVIVSPSVIKSRNIVINWLRQFFWKAICLKQIIILAASGRSSRDIIFTPNIIISASL